MNVHARPDYVETIPDVFANDARRAEPTRRRQVWTLVAILILSGGIAWLATAPWF